MKNTALVIAVLIILGGVGWFLLHSEVVEAPVLMDKVGEEPDRPTPARPLQLVDSFAACVAAGNPVMESYPRQCRHNGELFIESVDGGGELVACTLDAMICPDGSTVGRVGPDCEFAACPDEGVDDELDSILCSPESKGTQICTMEYAPVCGSVAVQCVTTPCDPIPETFSNACVACGQGNVISYTPGACEVIEV